MTTQRSARVFVHPHVLSPLIFPMLQKTLEDHGWKLDNLVVGPANLRGHHELMWQRSPLLNKQMQMERLDGSSFLHTEGYPAPAPVYPEGAA